MKIGLILERFDPARGGLENWTHQFARSLTREGHEAHILAFEFPPDVERDGLVTHRLEMPRSRLERAELVAATLPGLKLDIIHDMGVGWHADIIHPQGGSTMALWEHNLLRIPKWRQIRFWREKRYRELAELERRQHTRSSAVIVTASRMVQHHFEVYHHLPVERMHLIYNGVDVETFTPQLCERLRAPARKELNAGDDVIFFMLAHNLLLKNAAAAIRAMQELKSAGVRARLIIAGGRKQDRFIKLAQKLGVAETVTFLGVVDSPLPYYAAADAFIHPTWYDPCSLVTLEASASGLPVITTRFNGASELMIDGQEGYLLDHPEDAAALADRMKDLLDPARREQMGGAGRAMALQHTLEHQRGQFLDLYEEILAAKAR